METNSCPVLTTANGAPIGLQQAITAGPRAPDYRSLTGPIALGRFFGEGGPENLPADSDTPSGIEEVEIVADGQIAEPGMTPPMLAQPSVGLNFFGQRS
jgi:hypothetical protein